MDSHENPIVDQIAKKLSSLTRAGEDGTMKVGKKSHAAVPVVDAKRPAVSPPTYSARRF